MIFYLITFFALWRRVLGGWLSVQRALTVIVGGVASAAPFIIQGRWVEAGVVPALIALWILPSHNYGDFWPVIRRYQEGAIGYIVAKKYWKNSKLSGWSEIGELWLGACVGLRVWLVVTYGAGGLGLI